VEAAGDSPRRRAALGEMAASLPSFLGEIRTVAGTVAARSPRKGCTAPCDLYAT
jgi:hypothetical protein